jgi:hypothetical protein
MPALVRSDSRGVRLRGSWKKAIELTSSPEVSAIQTLALLDTAVRNAMMIVRAQASFQRSENQ